jgi:hypothetical protein
MVEQAARAVKRVAHEMQIASSSYRILFGILMASTSFFYPNERKHP